jgi:Zn-dependent peptidase ImmA (M78 family)
MVTSLVGSVHPHVVFNPSQGRRRKPSTLMHVLAHLILEHAPGMMFFGEGGLALRAHDAAQEDEANWLAGCLLLPREALLAARASGMTDEELCDVYGISAQMVRFRSNVTAIDRQLGARGRRGVSSARAR